MSATISKWGNGHGIHLSRKLMEEANISSSDKLEVIVKADKSIILRHVPKTKAARFMELFGDYEGDWKCCEAKTEAPVGNETIR